MSKFSKAIVLLAVLCIIIGAVIAGIGFSKGGIQAEKSFFFSFGREEKTSNKSGKIIPIQDFTALELQVSYGDVTVQQGDAYSLHVKNIPDEYYTINEEENKLTMIYKKDFFANFNFGEKDYEIVVTIPRDTVLESLLIESEMGDVKVSNLETKNLQIDQSMGEINVHKTLVNGDMRLDQKMGDIDFSGYARGNSTIENDMGDLDLTFIDLQADYAYTLSSSIGTVEINDKERSEGIGSEIKGGENTAPYRIKASASMGEISLEFNKTYEH